MSVYVDHFYIKPTKEAYTKLFDSFQTIIGEDLFQHGEFEVDGKSWSGFYVYFENGSFLEVLDPEISVGSQSVGLCMTCEKEYRGHFLPQVQDALTGKNTEYMMVPVEAPLLSICRIRPYSYLSSWGVEYSDQWMKEWGSQSSKLGLLSPFESFQSLTFVYPKEYVTNVEDNLSWIDPRLTSEENIALPLKGGSSTSVAFLEGRNPSCTISFTTEEDLEDFEISGEGFSFIVKNGVAAINTELMV